MRSRISLQTKISKKQKEDISEFAKQQVYKEIEDHTRRLLKIFCVAANREAGLGKIRLGRIINGINEIAEEHLTDELFWRHTDKWLSYMRMDFEPEDYRKLENLLDDSFF